jgi:hypothetical protein
MTKLIGSAEFTSLVDAASGGLDIPVGDIEKDIWVVEVLRSIFRPIDGARVVFKGGTSLSKAYGLIERFSEDVDLLVIADAGMGARQRERTLKTLPARAAAELGIETKKEGESDRGVHRAERLQYWTAYPDTGRVAPGVLLEMGIRGGSEPAEVREIRSYAAEWALRTGKAAEGDFEEFTPVQVVALRPERTLVEKLGLLHHLAMTYPASATKVPAAGRHVYDIFRLLGDPAIQAALAQEQFASRIAMDSERWSAENDWPYSPRPAGGFAESPAFREGTQAAAALAFALEHARTLIWGVMPSYDEVIGRIRAARQLL